MATVFKKGQPTPRMANATDFDNFAAAQRMMGRKVKTYARNAYLPGYENEDIEAELLIVLWRCVQQYDPDKGASFNTYVQTSFQRAIRSMHRKVVAMSRIPPQACVSLNIESFDTEEEGRALSETLTSGFSAEDEVMVGQSVTEHFVALTPRRQKKILRELACTA